MPSASARARTPRYKTEPLDLQAMPQREQGSVATARIVEVGAGSAKRAARSGKTRQIPGPFQAGPGPAGPERPQFIYARTIRATRSEPDPASWDHEPHTGSVNFAEALQTASRMFDAPRQRIAELQLRATRALSGLQENTHTQQIVTGTWSKPSTRIMCIGVAVYAFILFLFAILGR